MAISLTALVAAASVLSTTGQVQAGGSVPASLAHGAHESPWIQVYDEAENITVSSVAGIPAGTYNSYLVHFDPINDGGSIKTRVGTATFSTDILYIIRSSNDLDASDLIFNSGLLNGQNSRGSLDGDIVSFTGDTLNLRLAVTGSNVDQVRVITAPSLPTTKADCKKGGWDDYGVFKNQGDCVSFVATGGKNLPSGG